MIRLFLVLMFVFLRGDAVFAVDIGIEVSPDKAFYRPGESIHLTVTASGGENVTARITHLADITAELTALVVNGNAELIWTPPAISMRGYGVDIDLLDASGAPIATASTAFDVLDHWIQAPRYGFLSEFAVSRPAAEQTMQWIARHHVNGLQFYDWQYRHEQLLPESDIYTDILGRAMSMRVVRSLIDAAHDYNIAAMPYTAIYGASPAFFQTHRDWALYHAPDLAYDFADGLLMIMNPAPGTPWTNHLLDQFAQVLEQTKFDGIHIDQYGSPMRGRSSDGELVRLDEAFPAFINAAAEVVEEHRGDDGVTIFNLVRNWPVTTVAPSNEDAVYIEVWEPYRTFLDLYRLVTQAQVLGGGKPVIIAAYIPADRMVNIRLANSLIFAAGGYHLELGEPEAMLAHAYFPNFQIMNEETQAFIQRQYDFLVRYENLLALGTSDATASRAEALAIDGIITQGTRSRDRVAVIVREGDNRETFSLINMIGIDGEYWDAPVSEAPDILENLQIRLQVSRPVTRVYTASPDQADLSTHDLEFSTDGSSITLSLPQLEYWSMIVVEYAS